MIIHELMWNGLFSNCMMFCQVKLCSIELDKYMFGTSHTTLFVFVTPMCIAVSGWEACGKCYVMTEKWDVHCYITLYRVGQKTRTVFDSL